VLHPISHVVTPYTRSGAIFRIGPEYIHAISKTGANRLGGGERHGCGVGLRSIEEHLTTRRPNQCRKHCFGGGAVISDQ